VKTEISEEGESIDDVAIDIARAIVPHGGSNEFLDKLRSAGFSFDTYIEDRFIVRSKYFWESNPSQTPFIQYSDIDRGLRPVTNINYQILETEIKLTEIDDFGNLLN
jgi:hypothetical protein